MKNHIVFALLISFLSVTMYAQETTIDVKVGDVFIIGEVDNDSYKYIDFPRANFIIKRGGIANYKKVKGEKVIITSIREQKDGSLLATLALRSNQHFFNSHKHVTAEINEAILQNELIRI
ncbi:dihydroorotase [Aquimarina intermedia]|uniref:Dihydroorotase n=1 Tax=Aquimarina intermedia TaxID=350814 RepID=A0A5S5BWB9_9FLAO|nr:dihydroorotase [Aquimarina intermedia]TYP69913.1 hypothetical protein BD809_11610 [Aquimarina intermedia]